MTGPDQHRVTQGVAVKTADQKSAYTGANFFKVVNYGINDYSFSNYLGA